MEINEKSPEPFKTAKLPWETPLCQPLDLEDGTEGGYTAAAHENTLRTSYGGSYHVAS